MNKQHKHCPTFCKFGRWLRNIPWLKCASQLPLVFYILSLVATILATGLGISLIFFSFESDGMVMDYNDTIGLLILSLNWLLPITLLSILCYIVISICKHNINLAVLLWLLITYTISSTCVISIFKWFNTDIYLLINSIWWMF